MGSEVLIIGGGVIGLSIARELRKKGVREIVVVDRGKPGREASWAAAGMLAPNIEIETSSEFHRFGVDALELYPAFAAELLDETGIDVELDRTGTLCLAFDQAESEHLDVVFEEQRKRGVAVERLSAASIVKLEPSISSAVVSGLLYSGDWQVENRRLVRALRRSLELKSVQMVENTEIATLLHEGEKITGAQTTAGRLYADVTILATGAWTSLIKIGDAGLPFDVSPVRGQMISFVPAERLLRHVVYSHRGYVVPRADGRILVGATVENAGFDKSVTGEAVHVLSNAASEILPDLVGVPVAESWAGLRPFVSDGLPVIGSVPRYQGVYVATAHYRNGILLAPLTAKIVAEEISERDHRSPYAAFRPDRFEPEKVSVTARGSN